MGRRVGEEARSLVRCDCSARSASRSIPRPGCGITRRSAATAARSSIPGGRPRRAAIMITPLPGATPTKPGSATLPFFGVDAAVVDDDGQGSAAQCRRQAGHSANLALDVARHLGRQSALQEAVLERVQRQLFHRRRRAARQGWLLLDRGPDRRRAERRRPSPRHLRNRKRAGESREGGGSRRGRPSR